MQGLGLPHLGVHHWRQRAFILTMTVCEVSGAFPIASLAKTLDKGLLCGIAGTESPLGLRMAAAAVGICQFASHLEENRTHTREIAVING